MILIFIFLSFVTLGCKSPAATGNTTPRAQARVKPDTSGAGSSVSRSNSYQNGNTSSFNASGPNTSSGPKVENDTHNKKLDELLNDCKKDPYRVFDNIQKYESDNKLQFNDDDKLSLVQGVMQAVSDDTLIDRYIQYYIARRDEFNLSEDLVLKIGEQLSNNLEIASVTDLSGSNLNKKIVELIYKKVKPDSYLSPYYITNDGEYTNINALPKDILLDLIKNHVKVSDSEERHPITTSDLLDLTSKSKYDADVIAELANKVARKEVSGRAIQLSSYGDGWHYTDDIYDKIKKNYVKYMQLSDDAIMNLINKCDRKPEMWFIEQLHKKQARDTLLIKLSSKVVMPLYDNRYPRGGEQNYDSAINYFVREGFNGMPEEALLNILEKIPDESVAIIGPYDFIKSFKGRYSDNVLNELAKKVSREALTLKNSYGSKDYNIENFIKAKLPSQVLETLLDKTTVSHDYFPEVSTLEQAKQGLSKKLNSWLTDNGYKFKADNVKYELKPYKSRNN